MSKYKKTFTLQHTRIVKGVIILFLMFHHLFYAKSRYDLMKIHFWDSEGVPCIQPFAYMCGVVCVYTFLMLSGYGIYRKLSKQAPVVSQNERTAPVPMVVQSYASVLRSLLKTMKNYWFALTIFAAFNILAGTLYPGTCLMDRLSAFLWDFFGLAYLSGTYTMNGAWWYMSALIFSYLLAPIFYVLTVRFPKAAFAACILIAGARYAIHPYYGISLLLYHTDIFWLGMLLARFDIPDICMGYLMTWKTWITALAGAALTAALIALRLISDDTRVSIVLAIELIIVLPALLSRMKRAGRFWAFLGIHSGNIYFIHSFFYNNSFKNLLYGIRYPALVYLILAAESLLTSIAFEKIKQRQYTGKIRQYILKTAGCLACVLCLYGAAKISSRLPAVLPLYLTYETGSDETFFVDGLNAHAVDTGEVLLSWNKNERADGYLIYRKTADGDYTYIGSAAECEFTDSNPAAGETNFYWVYPYSHREQIRGYAPQYAYAVPGKELS